MSAEISNLPRGLINLFGIRDMGAAPRNLSGEIVSTIDITEFLLVNREAVLPNTGSASTTGFHALVTVPHSELWRIHGYSVQTYDLGGPTTGTLRTAYIEQGGVHIGLGQTVTITAPSDNRLAMTQSPFWAVPGSRLGVWVESIAGGGSLAIQAAVVISRVRI